MFNRRYDGGYGPDVWVGEYDCRRAGQVEKYSLPPRGEGEGGGNRTLVLFTPTCLPHRGGGKGGFLIFTKDFLHQIDKITSLYEQKRAALIPVLHLVQEKEGFISLESEKEIAEYLGVPIVHVREVISFYHLFRQKPKGKCHFAVCQTTSCALLGAEGIIEYIKKRLGIKPGETTPDGKFSLSAVECLGACEIAPMMQCNKEYTGALTKEKIDELIKTNT